MPKLDEWDIFQKEVASHIENYAIKQYGDDDAPVNNYTTQECVNNILKYAARAGKNQRDGQEEIDLLKMAHYAQMAWQKIQESKHVQLNNYDLVAQEIFEELLPKTIEKLNSLSVTTSRPAQIALNVRQEVEKLSAMISHAHTEYVVRESCIEIITILVSLIVSIGE